MGLGGLAWSAAVAAAGATAAGGAAAIAVGAAATSLAKNRKHKTLIDLMENGLEILRLLSYESLKRLPMMREKEMK